MLQSYRTCTPNQLRNILKDSKQQSSMKASKHKNKANENEYMEIEALKQNARENQLKVMQLKNQLIKRQIQLKQKSQNIKQITKELSALRKQRESMTKTRTKFENERKNYQSKMHSLENTIEEMRMNFRQSSPQKDRYDTCLRELDQLKYSMDQKQDLQKQRDFYKFICQEIKELVTCADHSAEELQVNLQSLFKELSERGRLF